MNLHSLNGRGSSSGARFRSLLQVATSLVWAEASAPVVVGHVSLVRSETSKQITFHQHKILDKFHLRIGVTYNLSFRGSPTQKRFSVLAGVEEC
jgi:hypothetical protein